MARHHKFSIPRPETGLIPHYYRKGRRHDAVGYLLKHVLHMLDGDIPTSPHANVKLDMRLCAAVECEFADIVYLRLANDDAHDDEDRVAVLDEFVMRWDKLSWMA
jgi:hypothetical protein